MPHGILTRHTAGFIAALVAGSVVLAAGAAVRPARPVERITWQGVAALRPRLEARGITSASFAAVIDRIRRDNARRVAEGDLDHLIFYLLQSPRFTSLAPIEPALSAKAFVESSRIPPEVRSRTAAFVRALDSSDGDPRLAYFRELAADAFPVRDNRTARILDEYGRVMRFLYEKEFVAQRAANPNAAVAELYRTRGLSTDTAVEAGYLVYLGLGVVKSLQPDRRIRRVLIVGPGLDLAPRTGFRETSPPESYQPWAVIDALLALGLSRVDELEVVGADINPRVVEHLRRARIQPPVLTVASEIQDSDTVTLTEEYRRYFAGLGRAVGEITGGAGGNGRLRKVVQVHPAAAGALHAERLDVVTERLGGPPFDLVIATNILPYFDDLELTLALSNVAAMLAPEGVFLHNEARPLLRDLAADAGLPFEQSRHVVIATVRGAAAPLFDSVYLHRRAAIPANAAADRR